MQGKPGAGWASENGVMVGISEPPLYDIRAIAGAAMSTYTARKYLFSANLVPFYIWLTVAYPAIIPVSG